MDISLGTQATENGTERNISVSVTPLKCKNHRPYVQISKKEVANVKGPEKRIIHLRVTLPCVAQARQRWNWNMF